VRMPAASTTEARLTIGEAAARLGCLSVGGRV
jgi:hypothetical protein